MRSDVAVLANPRDEVGEGPIWVAEENAVYWVDLFAPSIHRLRFDGSLIVTWAMPELTGWLVQRTGGPGFIAGMRSRIVRLQFDPLEISPLVELDMRDDHRLNDAKVDAIGRLWAGTMHCDGATPTGSLLSLGSDLKPIVEDVGYLVSNGPTFSPCGKVLYHADSMKRMVYQFAMRDDGSLGPRQRFVEFPSEWGLPDGMTIDAEGCVWIAHWDGGRLSRFDSYGRIVRSFHLPASRITSCTFGGAALDRMFVTSAARDRAHEPLAGALFEIDPGVTGLPATPFEDFENLSQHLT